MNPVLLAFGPIEIKWYSFLLLVAIASSFFLVIKEAKKFNISFDFIFNLAFWTVIFGLIGARLYYVIFNFEVFKNDLSEVFKVWNGGLAIHGAIIFGALTIYLYTKKHQFRTIKMYDLVAVPLLLAQAIGRWGNFFNSEAHGVATTAGHLKSLHIPQFVIDNMNINGIYYTPTFLYESLWCGLGFIILLFVRRRKLLKVGQLTALYFIWYSLGRFFIEASRTDSLMFLGFKVAQIVSVLLLAIGIIILIVTCKKDKFEDLYNEEENVD